MRNIYDKCCMSHTASESIEFHNEPEIEQSSFVCKRVRLLDIELEKIYFELQNF